MIVTKIYLERAGKKSHAIKVRMEYKDKIDSDSSTHKTIAVCYSPEMAMDTASALVDYYECRMASGPFD